MQYFNSLESPFFDAETLKAETQAWQGPLVARGVHFEGSPEPFTPAPLVLDRAVYRRMADYLEPLAALLNKCIALYAASPDVQRFYGFPARVHELVAVQAAQRPPNWYCRFDFTLDESGVPRVVEFNGDCPAGLILQYHYQAMLDQSALARSYGAAAALRTLIEEPDFVPRQICALLGAQRGNVAILNSRHRTLRNEIELYHTTLMRAGLNSRTGYVEDVQCRDGRLWLDQQPIDLVLTKFDTLLESEASPPIGEHWQDIEAFETAIRQAAVPVFNSLAAGIVAESKETLALLHCDWFQPFLSEAERRLVQACVPLTIRLDQLDGARLRDVVDDKASWVLKKNMDTRGRSVVLGAEETAGAWAARVLDCRRTNARHYVVQRRVWTMVSRVAEAFAWLPPVVHTILGGFVVRGHMAGLLVRSSASAVTNIGRRGFIQPHLIV